MLLGKDSEGNVAQKKGYACCEEDVEEAVGLCNRRSDEASYCSANADEHVE